MQGFRTYRSRLIFYVSLLAAFMTLTLLVSSFYARDILLEEAESNTRRTARLLDTHMRSDYSEFLRYTDIVRNDIQLQEYMFVVVTLGAETRPLEELYNRQFGWLPVTKSALFDPDSRVIIGDRTISESVEQGSFSFSGATNAVYSYDTRGLKLLSSAPITYRQQELGHVLLCKNYDNRVLEDLERQSNGKLFVVRNNTIIFSSHYSTMGKNFDPYTGRLTINSETYMMHRINLPGVIATPGLELWFATSETALFENISRFNRSTLVIVLIAVIGMIVLGIYLLRNFQRPLQELADMTHEVAQGELPQIRRLVESNEIDSLSNKFMDMVQSLKEKQRIIDGTQKQLESLAVTDTLTGLYNRRYLLELFPKLYGQSQRNNEMLGAILIDIDYFKQINDSYGHLAGDACLREFASILQSCTRKNDFLFRMGGEEFLVLTVGELVNGVFANAEKIRHSIENSRTHHDNLDIKMTVSCGVAMISTSNKSVDTVMNSLLKHADSALYQAKQEGRNRTVVFKGDYKGGSSNVTSLPTN